METTDCSFEVILVNDASPDDETWEAIRELVLAYPFVRGFDLLFNSGQFRATICGFEHAEGDLIVTMDDDLQHPPEELPRLLEALRTQPAVDCVMGAYREKKHSIIRNFGSHLMARLNEILYNKPKGLRTSSFRAMRRQVAEAICAHGTSKPILGPLLLRSTRRIVNVDVEHHARSVGRSGYNLRRMIRVTLDNLISGSTLPLKVVSLFGLVAATASTFLGVFYLVQYLSGSIRVPGFATQVLLISFFGGMSLFSIGLVGEYLIRIIHEVGRPPRYFVRAIARHSHEESTATDDGSSEIVQVDGSGNCNHSSVVEVLP